MSEESRVCLVTGAGSGIGFETTRLFAQQGDTVVGVDLKEPKGTSFASLFLTGDLSKIEQIDRIVSTVLDQYGRIDVLVNCAGVASRTGILDLTPEEWDKVMDINLKATFFLAQKVLPGMVERGVGAIVNIASTAGKLGGITVGAHYSASKAGIECVTKSLAQFGATRGVRVNAVCPGPTATPMTDSWGSETNRELSEKIPMKRYGTPEEVARAIRFLASDEASYITGEILDVNGGLIMD